jgi:hypothetical protein
VQRGGRQEGTAYVPSHGATLHVAQYGALNTYAFDEICALLGYYAASCGNFFSFILSFIWCNSLPCYCLIPYICTHYSQLSALGSDLAALGAVFT